MSGIAVEVSEDLITDILQFLPAKTLLRFRCGSKSLLGIIDGPDFIKRHLAITSQNETHRKIIVQDTMQLGHSNPVQIHIFHIDDPLSELREGNSTGFIRNTVFAHCNGLVVLEEEAFSLVVWNPTTRNCWKLPILPREVPKDLLGNCIGGLCFGYDSSVDDYKVMLIKERMIITAEYDHGDYDCDEKHEMWILGLKSGCWRMIEHPYYIIYDSRNCFVDGAFHFRFDNDAFAFNLAKETFSQVSPPDQIREYQITLQVLEE